MNKIIKTKHIKKLLGVSRYTSSVKKIEEFLDTYCLPVDRVFVHTITSQSGLVDFKTRRKKEVRKKGEIKVMTWQLCLFLRSATSWCMMRP
jgi:hypothetical protein